jgi:hypothetical protein
VAEDPKPVRGPAPNNPPNLFLIDKAKNAQYNEKMNDPNFKGVPMDKGLLEFSEGKAPFSDRHCTDVCCCIVFCVYIFHCSLIALDGFANGDPLAYFYMYDMDGNFVIVSLNLRRKSLRNGRHLAETDHCYRLRS